MWSLYDCKNLYAGLKLAHALNTGFIYSVGTALAALIKLLKIDAVLSTLNQHPTATKLQPFETSDWKEDPVTRVRFAPMAHPGYWGNGTAVEILEFVKEVKAELAAAGGA